MTSGNSSNYSKKQNMIDPDSIFSQVIQFASLNSFQKKILTFNQ